MKFKTCSNKLCLISAITHGEDDKYCWYCGSSLVSMDYVCSCGRELGACDKYCPKCGLKRGEEVNNDTTKEEKR